MNIMRPIFTVVVIAFVLLLTFQEISTARSSRNPYRVSVTVQADESIERSINSYIKRELRSINDVVIVDTDAAFELRVLGGEIKQADAIVIHYTVLETLHCSYVSIELYSAMKDFLEVNFPEMDIVTRLKYQNQFYKILLEKAPDLRHYGHGGLEVGSFTYLEKFCRRIVATFDTVYLEPQRRGTQAGRDFFRGLGKKFEGKDSSE
ncbi:MAG: hypothetical protein L6406_14970 [Desulfobacterales bacterium]|nr:hypothetical protein [Desulfobacterales bacterium]